MNVTIDRESIYSLSGLVEIQIEKVYNQGNKYEIGWKKGGIVIKKTIGVFAHVDAGKTTFCETLLYEMKKRKERGRVDDRNTLMDHDEIEKRRGITVFSDVASFYFRENEYYIVDTPGHTDFAGEMERVLPVLDGAILLISAADGVQSHTITLFYLLKDKKIPVFFFVNKVDQTGISVSDCLDDIRKKLTRDVFYIEGELKWNEEAEEWLCDYDEQVLEHYVDGSGTEELLKKSFRKQVNSGTIYPVLSGSALKQQGIKEVIETIDCTLEVRDDISSGFAARVFKVIYDAKDTRITFLKCISGQLRVKDEVELEQRAEKIHEIRKYDGDSYTNITKAEAGDIVGVTGLSETMPGDVLGECRERADISLKPALKAAVLMNRHTYDEVMKALKKLEAGEPLLEVNYQQQLKEIEVCIMGKIQLEVLKEIAADRYGLDIDFGPCKVLYKETVAAPVIGYGHYEPLRHYAEVHVRIEPSEAEGYQFESECHINVLAKQYQHVIRQHLMEKAHAGVLTGSPLTNVKFVLTAGAAHLKHTEGGDFREASWRAVRQGLEQAESVLLEPYYSFRIDIDVDHMGRVLSDIQRFHGDAEPARINENRAVIIGRGPVATFMNYNEELLSFTKGSGAVSMNSCGYYSCHNPEEVIEQIGYERERDLENVSSSIFCKKGAGYEVKGKDAKDFMHLLK